MKIFKYMALALAAALTMGCVQEYMEVDPDKVPSASDLQVRIEVDQTTNYVTFSIENEGMVPMWLFGEEQIDGKANKKYAYTGNGLQLRIRDAGEHSVEVKAYNAHGVSVGSVVETFSLENTYRDPFDPSQYFKAIKGEWMWNSDVAGHFGCGPSVASPFEWWQAVANEKADWSLYNDRMTFTEDGKYLFNPGEDGKVYVHNSFTELGTTPDGNDFMVDVAAYETTYSFENNWNDAGIEEVWLVLPAKKNLSYIPNQQNYDAPRFLVMDSKPSAMRKELKLAASEAPNGDGFISWYYDFIPAVKVATPEELLAGADGNGKVWVMDSETAGHLACGPSAENPTEWWSAPINDKSATGLYDDEITFYPDGKYVYSSGEDGLMYINWGVTVIGPNPGVEPDIDISWPVTESTYAFDGETITLASSTPMVYVPSDAMWANPVFKVTELTETVLKVVAMNEGCYWQMIFRARDAQAEPEPEKPAVAPFDPESADNLWKNAAIDNITYWFANSDWQQIADPEAVIGTDDYTFVTPDGIGGGEWQGQVVFRNTGLVLTTDKTYDFRVLLSATADGTATVKPCWQHPTELDGSGNPLDVNELFYKNDIALTAYDEVEFVMAGLAGTDIPDLKLVFDFGRFPGGTTITVKGIVIRESKVAADDSQADFPGEQLELLDAADVIVGTWTWEASTDGHFGCGEAIANPCGWWNGTANCKEGCSMYDDLMTFAEDGTYIYDPVDGMTFMNVGVTVMNDKKVDNPTVPGASAPEGDFRVTVGKQTATWRLDESGEFPAIILPAGTVFSYIPNDAFLDAPELYITGVWENQLEISAYTATGNGGGPIAWRYRLKRVNQ